MHFGYYPNIKGTLVDFSVLRIKMLCWPKAKAQYTAKKLFFIVHLHIQMVIRQ